MTAAAPTDSLAPRPPVRAPSMAAVAAAGSVGTVIEWYDFLLYATATPLVFNKLFFPAVDPAVGTLAALGSYAVGFVARPFGAALFGHYGDRLGRRTMLMASLFVTGGATFLIGLLPTYGTVGVLAPALLVLLRIAQGIGLGGEWGGAALLVVEHAPPGRRGFYGSLVQVGFPLGLVLSTLAVAAAARLGEATFLAWGWRLPFLGSAALFLVGAFVRARVAETPVFRAMERDGRLAASPLGAALARAPGPFLAAVGLKLTEVSWVYILTVFVAVYASTRLALPKAVVLDGVLYAALLELATIPFVGWLSDRIGRRAFFIAGALFTIVFAFPLFRLLDGASPALVVVAIVAAMNLGHGPMFALEATTFSELFEGPVRCTGAGFGFQVAAAIGGGGVPLAATWLAGKAGGTAGVSIMLIALAGATLAAALASRETRGRPLG